MEVVICCKMEGNLQAGLGFDAFSLLMSNEKPLRKMCEKWQK
jgi:hypothetical protein